MIQERNLRAHLMRPLIGVMVAMSFVALAEAQAPAQRAMTSYGRTEWAYPTGDRATSILLLERFVPANVRMGEAFTYEVKLTNLTRAELRGMVVTEQFAQALNVTSITPEPTRRASQQAIWEIPRFGGGQSVVFRIGASPERMEDLTSCAQVTFTTQTCATTKVVQPELALVKTAPAEVLVCDPIPLRFVVTNTGTGVARNVQITDRLPDGLTTTDGRQDLAFNAGDLAAGASREFSATVRAARTGQYLNTAKATEAGGLTVEATAMTVVRQPVLALSKTGPAFRYLRRPATFQLTVRNDGDAVAANTVLVDTIPAGTEFVEASDSGSYGGGKVTWNFGALAPGASRSVSLTLKPTRVGVIENTAVAQAVCAQASAAVRMEVKGIPAILIEVVDVHDPIEVGNQETYQITVVNQGSATGTNIAITCELPPEEDFVSVAGPTNATAAGKTISFAPLPSLAPRERATYHVNVKGVATGDVRFKVSMISDQMTSSVDETESTHIYE